MRQAAPFLAIFAAVTSGWAGPTDAAGPASEFFGYSYRIDAGRHEDSARVSADVAAIELNSGRHFAARSLPVRLEELLLKPEIAIPAPMAASVPPAGPDQLPAYEDLWDRIRGGFAIPHLASPLVDRWQAWYLARPQVLKGILERSRRYLFHVVEETSRRGMPLELALLPMVESGYNPVALSPAQASGLWQFIPSTARDYKLHLAPDYDARRDIVASTSAALDYLRDLHDLFGDWHLALAAYNWGEKAIAKAVQNNVAKGLPADFTTLALPEETRNYVPKLQALKNLIAYPETFRLELESIPNQPYFTTIASDRGIDFAVAARLSGVSLEELSSLNPAHNGSAVSKNAASGLVLPVDRAETFLINLENYKNATPAKPAKRRSKL